MTTLDDAEAAVASAEEERRSESIRRRNRELKAENERLRAERERADEISRLVEHFDGGNLDIPQWTRDGSGKSGHHAIATLQLRDLHLDEVISAKQILDYNQYDRRIAELRLKKLGDGTLKLARDYMAGVEYDGACVLATGDIFSGDIHEELRITNEATLFEGVEFWVPRMVAFLKLLADDFLQLHVAAVVGNHGRMTQKPVYKNRTQSNIEWLFWHWVADRLADDERIRFQIADGLADVVTLYSTRYSIEHGDEFRGGSGISGAMAPLLLGQHRTSVQRMAMGTPVDYLVVGHFHQYRPPSAGIIMGGSMKGYDEYAAGKHFRPERPQQGFWLTSPEHGPTIAAPIFCDDRKAEGW